METFFTLLVAIPPLLVAVILHEVAHGYIAERLGDPTARALGRITLNPLVHIDWFMTIILPGLLIFAGSPVVFGGAKPVPVNPLYFKNPRRGMVWVALAGPAINIIIACICYLALKIIFSINPPQAISIPTLGIIGIGWLTYSVVINLVLALFNLVPVPPLDGGRIAVGLLPVKAARMLARLEPFGLFIVFALLYSGAINAYLSPVIEFTLKHLSKL